MENKVGSLISLCPGEIGVLKFVIKILEFNGEEATFYVKAQTRNLYINYNNCNNNIIIK